MFADFSFADVLIVVSYSIGFYYTLKLFTGLDQRIKALEDRLKGK